jgi:hypothetical protein
MAISVEYLAGSAARVTDSVALHPGMNTDTEEVVDDVEQHI